ncbi:MAG: RNA polymerase sigma-70 factor [Bacteroidetes bacterium]|nr:RNA polymerase sigma-70 factor [Bacteroidota bacterium]
MEWNESVREETVTVGNEKVFEEIFKTHFKNLHAYACTILNDASDAEEMVQQVFYKVWEKKIKLDIHTSVKAYLYRSVHNECMNYIKHQKVKTVHRQYSAMQEEQTIEKNDPARQLTGNELEKKISAALNDLPEQCRTVFQLSRFESLKYHEIAFQLGISVKTVEAQMGKALKRLRLSLVEYLPVFIPFLYFILNRMS